MTTVDTVALAEKIRGQRKSDRDLVALNKIMRMEIDEFVGLRQEVYAQHWAYILECESFSIETHECAAVLRLFERIAPNMILEYWFDYILGKEDLIEYGYESTPGGRLIDEVASQVSQDDFPALLYSPSFEFEKHLYLLRLYSIIKQSGVEGLDQVDSYEDFFGECSARLPISAKRAVANYARRFLLGKVDSAHRRLYEHREMAGRDVAFLRTEVSRRIAEKRDNIKARRLAVSRTLERNPGLSSLLNALKVILHFSAYLEPRKHELRGMLNISNIKRVVIEQLRKMGADLHGDSFSYTWGYLLDSYLEYR